MTDAGEAVKEVEFPVATCQWTDTSSAKARLVHSRPEHLDYVPDNVVTQH
jgi:hypothetical protein